MAQVKGRSTGKSDGGKVGQTPSRAPAGPSNLMSPSPEPKVMRLRAARRCNARSKRHGGPCGAPSMRGKLVCYHHGGASTGAPRGAGNGAYKSGEFTILHDQIMRRLAGYERILRKLDKAKPKSDVTAASS
jgi:hypothetical protein